jgi:flagellar motor switch protein FliN
MKEGECAMETRPNLDDQQTNAGLNSIEIDTIGEILNISMGAAATAVSILLNRQVSITTPSVQVVPSSEFEFSELEPALGIEIKYVQGLFGSNQMIMSVKDIKAIVQLLLGEDFGVLSDGTEAPLDEIHVSALGEVMNQMMGASCTALASFLDREINISPPEPFELSGINEKLLTEEQDLIVAVGFKLTIEDLVDSEFFTVMPVPFARELVNSAMGISGQDMGQEVSEISQVTGHTQVPMPVIGDDYQATKAAPKPAPEAAPKPAPAAAPKSAPAVAPKSSPAVTNRPAPETVSRHVPESMPEPAPAQVFDPEPAEAFNQEPEETFYQEPEETFYQEPAEMPAPAVTPRPAPAAAARPAPAVMQRPAAAVTPRAVPSAIPKPAPMASPRSVPAGGNAQDRGAPRQNVVVKPLQFGNLDMMDAFSDEIDAVNLGLVMGVDLNVTVEIGRTRKQVKEILSLRQGSIVELDKQAGAPVDIMVNGKLIARGDVVVIDDNFGVRITEIVSSAAQK